ncbi:hypothetical protein [Pseudonocardia sp.]|uniref:hypothetical protein n=1 Tax=Pseudonocardia sp. TaxID=60912 RepID=UPI002606B3E7|nr:hypothetical protein [Pseudonocardia sp.]
MTVVEVVVVYDVACPSCSEIARELPDLLRVPVVVRSCRDPHLATAYPTLATRVRSCATPALGTVRTDGTIRWWPGLTGAIGVLPVVRLRDLAEAVALLRTALRASR